MNLKPAKEWREIAPRWQQTVYVELMLMVELLDESTDLGKRRLCESLAAAATVLHRAAQPRRRRA